jgi:hypothetical protein
MVFSDALTRDLHKIAWDAVLNFREPPGGIQPEDPNSDRDDGASNLERQAGALGLVREYTRMIKVLQRRIDVTVDAALGCGASYGQVAAACGVSRQAARQRWLRNHWPDERATAHVAGGPPGRDGVAGADEAAPVAPVSGASAFASPPPNRPGAEVPGRKVRVYQLAQEFGVSSKVVMARLQALGEFITSASMPVPLELVRQLRAEFSTQPTIEISEGPRTVTR